MVVHNFGPGPGVLPMEAIEKSRDALLDFAGTGMSILEISHRSKEFESVVNNAANDIKTLLSLPSNYHVLFVQGGASNQFSAVPLNLVASFDQPVDYLVTGTWSKKAHQEAKRYLGDNAKCVSTDLKTFKWSRKPAYFYYCENETVDGLELTQLPLEEFGAPYSYKDVPVICDMSSNFLSRPVPNVEKYAMILAGAQKNVGPAGVTILIIRDDLLQLHRDKLHKHVIPVMLDYLIAQTNNSLYNTPPVFSIYVSSLVLQWIKQNGGLKWIGECNQKKAKLLYDEIESSNDFYKSPVPKQYSSRMNVVFRIYTDGTANADLEKQFAKEAESSGLLQLPGHRSVGGLRASLYNALEYDSVKALVEFMKTFQKKHGKTN